MFEFIGIGSAFNTQLGNNGGFIKRGSTLFLIDCGSATFDRLVKFGVLNDVKSITVLMTHCHPDHVGSLGDLIFYAWFLLNADLTIVAPPDLMLPDLLQRFGVKEEQYQFHAISSTETLSLSDIGSMEVTPVHTMHVPELTCFGYILRWDGQTIYYSGDANIIPEHILNMLTSGTLDLMYQDTSQADYENNPHLSLRKLSELVEPEFRDKVWCMHLDTKFDVPYAESLGFHVVRLAFSSHSG